MRGPVAVCPCCRGPWGGCVGRPARVSIWRKGGRVASGKLFFACTTAALPAPPDSPRLQEEGASVSFLHLFPVDQVALPYARVHDPVFPRVEVEVLVLRGVEPARDAVGRQMLHEPLEFRRVPGVHLEAVEMWDVRHRLGEDPVLGVDKGPRPVLIAHFVLFHGVLSFCCSLQRQRYGSVLPGFDKEKRFAGRSRGMTCGFTCFSLPSTYMNTSYSPLPLLPRMSWCIPRPERITDCNGASSIFPTS